MRRLAVVLGTVMLAAAFTVVPANAVSDVKGPACADIVDGGGDWYAGTLTFAFVLAKPPCKSVTYTVYAAAADASGNPTGTVYSTSSYTVDPDGRLVFTLSVPDPDPATACTVIDIYGTTTVRKPHRDDDGEDGGRQGRVRSRIADRAPDVGYLQLPDDAFSCPTGSRTFH